MTHWDDLRMKHLDFWIKATFGDFPFFILLALAFLTAILSLLW